MKKNQILIAIILVLVVFFAGFFLAKFTTKESVTEITKTGFSPNPSYEYLVGAAAWQMSAEAHALMIQGFNIAKHNLQNYLTPVHTILSFQVSDSKHFHDNKKLFRHLVYHHHF